MCEPLVTPQHAHHTAPKPHRASLQQSFPRVVALRLLEALALAAGTAEEEGPLPVSLGTQGESLVAALVCAAAEGAPTSAVPGIGETLALLLRLPGWCDAEAAGQLCRCARATRSSATPKYPTFQLVLTG